MWSKILELFCLYFMELDIFEKFITGGILMELTKWIKNVRKWTMSELHTDDKKSYSRNPNHILQSAKNFSEKLYIKETNVQNRHYWTSNKQFHHCEGKIVLKKVTNSISCQTNINSSGNDSVTTKFYKRLSNELTYNVYQ